jgi:hypothetical protein
MRPVWLLNGLSIRRIVLPIERIILPSTLAILAEYASARHLIIAATQSNWRLILRPRYAPIMSYGRRLGYDWRMDTIRYTFKAPPFRRGDWPRCGAHRKREGRLAKQGR